MAERTFVRLVPVLLAAASAVFLLAPARTEVLRERDPHAHFQNPGFCKECHLLVEGEPVPDRFAANADDFCFECHRSEALGRSHPRNVRPKDKDRRMRVPEEYRLDDDGRIICLTCHRGHGKFLSAAKAYPGQRPEEGTAAGGTPSYRTFYLRRSDPERGFALLCGGCHLSL